MRADIPTLLAVCLLAAPAAGEDGGLGKVVFPTSARAPKAQAHFLRGVAALHSFWYPVALDEFRAAAKLEPGFMMAYWGEAMAHNHPIWGDPQETEAARQALKKVEITAKLTPRERAYLRAVGLLYGEGEKPARDRAYAEAMRQLHEDYPKDLEAAAFYALALLGTIPTHELNDPSSVRVRMRAAAVAQEVSRKEPNHPGAAHYLLHAFDDPDHAILALPVARRYAKIAPEAPHALHMPSHIFLQLGLWPEAAASNEAAWKASGRWVKRKGLPVSERDYHSLHWLHYVYLQQGRYREAEDLLTTMRKNFAEFPRGDARHLAYGAYTLSVMAAAQVVETERWGAADKLLPAAPAKDKTAGAAGRKGPYQAFAALARAPAVFARGLAEASQGSDAAGKSVAELRAIRKQLAGADLHFAAGMSRHLEVQELEIAAARRAAKGDLDGAIETLKKATALEEAVPPPPGPPPVIKPSHELLGEVLLRAKRPERAAEQFAKSLYRHPDRARSLLGAARAAAKVGPRERAEAAYAKFLRQWKQADGAAPEVREARGYLKRGE